MRKKTLFVLMVVGLVASTYIVGWAAPTPLIKWKGQNGWNPGVALGPYEDSSGAALINLWVKWIEEVTDRRLVIELAPVGSIFPTTESFKAVSKGVVPIVGAWESWFTGAFPEGDIVAQLPMAYDYPEDVFAVYYKYGLYDLMQKAHAKHNIYWIPTMSSRLQSWNSKFAINSPEDIKGKVFRAAGIGADIINMLGGKAVPIPYGEVYMAMKLGTIDGYSGGISMLEDVKLKEVVRYYVEEPTLYFSISSILINMDAFNKLPADIRKIIDKQSRYIIADTTMYRFATEQYQLSHTPEVQFVRWSKKDISRLRKMVIETIWPKLAGRSPVSKEAIDILIKFQKDHGRY